MLRNVSSLHQQLDLQAQCEIWTHAGLCASSQQRCYQKNIKSMHDATDGTDAPRSIGKQSAVISIVRLSL